MRVAETVPEVERLRPLWDAAPIDELDSDIDYFLDVLQASPDACPHVVVLDRAGRDPILVIARLTEQVVRFRIGYRTVGRSHLRSLALTFGGVVGVRTDEDVNDVVSVLTDQLRHGGVDLLYLPKLAVGSPLFDALRGLPARGLSVREETSHWTIELADSWEEFLGRRSGESRRKLRADDSRFERAYEGRFEMRRLDLPEHRHRMDKDLETVACRTYQQALGVGATGDFERKLMAAALDRDRARVWMLYIDDQPVAFWAGIVHGSTCHLGTTGYDAEYAKARVGYYAMRRVLEDLNNDPSMTSADFGHGDADYKARFGTSMTLKADVVIYGGGVRARAVRFGLAVTSGLTRAGKWVAERTGRTSELKRWLRRRALAGRGDQKS
ncbi:MAG: GNAT family N-acetyltransferase [Nocardioidaceae bacterium]